MNNDNYIRTCPKCHEKTFNCHETAGYFNNICLECGYTEWSETRIDTICKVELIDERINYGYEYELYQEQLENKETKLTFEEWTKIRVNLKEITN